MCYTCFCWEVHDALHVDFKGKRTMEVIHNGNNGRFQRRVRGIFPPDQRGRHYHRNCHCSEEEITLDLKYYAQGIIKVEDFSNDPDFAVLEQIHAGDEIEATVVKTDDGQGNILLSRKEANDVLAWEKLQQMMEDGTVVKVRIKESVPSGVVTFLEGIRAFIPASQLALDYVEDTESWIGKEVEAKVITVDPEKEKLVLSARQVAKEAAIEERNHKISMIVPGTVMEGTVESLMPYGAFINLGNGLSGLVHISQICERRIKKPSEVLKEGQKVKAKVLNTNDNKISLSMKALEEEMVDTEPAEDLEQYTSKESFGSSLGSLLAGIKLD